MKEFKWIVAAILVIPCGVLAYNYAARQSASAAWNNQKWGEIANAPHSFTLKPGQWIRFGPVNPTGSNVRYDVSSSLAVNTGLVSSGKNWPDGATCFEAQVLSSVKSCTVPFAGDQWIFVQDNRGNGDLLSGVLLGNHNAADESRVTVTTYRWGCVADCVKSDDK
jgi:hypothetical protein